MTLDVLHLTARPSRVIAREAPLRVETVSDPVVFEQLGQEWNDLLQASRADRLFMTWEWLHTWWLHLSGGATLTLLMVRRGPELVAIAPFLSKGRSLLGAPRLSFLGVGRVGSDYLDVIVRHGAENEAIPALAEQLVAMGATLEMNQLRITSSAGSLLVREMRDRGCPVRAARTHRCPYIPLEGASFEGSLGSLGSEHRYNYLRKLRKLETQHSLRFERVSSESRRIELLPVVFDLHRRRWSERGGSDGLVGEDVLRFHEAVSRIALERGWLRLFVLWLGDTPAATLYGFRYRGVFSFYQSGFDPRFSKLSVGLVALGLTIRSAIAEGASEFDLLHGTEAYKFHWAKEARRLGCARTFPRGPLGHLAGAASSLVDTARRAAHRLPQGVVSRISAVRDRVSR